MWSAPIGSLYVVPTPVGNLEDITLRALRVLREVKLIAAEDTRTTGKLLAHFEIKTPLISYHEHNKLIREAALLEALRIGDVALVSDAGTPGLSDPGAELIRAALAADIPIVPLPGPSALLPALVASGLPTDSFLYIGFLPRKASSRRAAIQAVAEASHTLALYEAPHRLVETLADLLDRLGPRRIVIARELTKLHEELWRGTVAEALAEFTQREPRGEITLIIEGAQQPDNVVWAEERVRAALADHLAAGESRSSAARSVAEQAGWPRRAVYDLDVE